VAKTVTAGQVSGREAVRRGEGHLDGAGRRQVRAETGTWLAVDERERTDGDGGHREFVFLKDDETDASAGGGVDAIPAEELFYRERIVRLIGLTEIVGEGAEAARVPPAPGGEQRDAEQKAGQRRGEATEPGMPEEELQHEGEGR